MAIGVLPPIRFTLMFDGRSQHLNCVSAGGGVGPQQNETKDWNLGLDYNKYLQQVVEVSNYYGRKISRTLFTGARV